MHVFFANTGVQIVCVPLGGGRYQSARSATAGSAALRTRRGERSRPRHIPTSSGRSSSRAPRSCSWRWTPPAATPRSATSARPASLTKDFVMRLEGLLGPGQQAAAGLPPVEFCIRPATATAGDAKHVHMVVDFGNSRTGALLVELSRRDRADAADDALRAAQPLSSRRLERGRRVRQHAGRPLVLLEDPLVQHALPAAAVAEEDRVPRRRRRRGSRPAGSAAARSPRQNKVEVVVTPPLFDDLSMVRMGREADDVVQVMRAEGDIRTGLSSPKRYLWADDASWLEGANWHMADPADRCRTGHLRRHAPRALPPLRPRGRPRLPPAGRRPEAERLRLRGAAEAPPRPPRDDDRRALRTALPGLHLRQFDGLPHGLRRRRPHPRDPHPLAHLSQRHDPGRAAAAGRPGAKGDQHLRHDAGQEPARAARAEPEHRRGQRRPPDLHLERAADARPGPAALVHHLAPGPRPEEAQGGRGRRAGRAPAPAARRRGRPGLRRPGAARRRAAAAEPKPSATRPTRSASPASTSAAAPPT